MKNFFQAFNEEIDKELKKCDTCESAEELTEAAPKDGDVDQILFKTPMDKLVFKQAQEITDNNI